MHSNLLLANGTFPPFDGPRLVPTFERVSGAFLLLEVQWCVQPSEGHRYVPTFGGANLHCHVLVVSDVSYILRENFKLFGFTYPESCYLFLLYLNQLISCPKKICESKRVTEILMFLYYWRTKKPVLTNFLPLYRMCIMFNILMVMGAGRVISSSGTGIKVCDPLEP